jgi:hypothetical protein
MYVCMYECIYECMYVCMLYVCVCERECVLLLHLILSWSFCLWLYACALCVCTMRFYFYVSAMYVCWLVFIYVLFNVCMLVLHSFFLCSFSASLAIAASGGEELQNCSTDLGVLCMVT